MHFVLMLGCTAPADDAGDDSAGGESGAVPGTQLVAGEWRFGDGEVSDGCGRDLPGRFFATVVASDTSLLIYDEETMVGISYQRSGDDFTTEGTVSWDAAAAGIDCVVTSTFEGGGQVTATDAISLSARYAVATEGRECDELHVGDLVEEEVELPCESTASWSGAPED